MTNLRHTDISQQPLTECLQLLRSNNVGPVTFFHLLRTYATPSAALDALPGIRRRGGDSTALRIPRTDSIEQEIEQTEKLGARYIAYGSPEYPFHLTQIHDPPPFLIAKGPLPLKTEHPPMIAMVGARNASANGRQLARTLAYELAGAGCVVVSGLARGVDTEAHQGALKATGGGTVAVIATGLDKAYPQENKALHQTIATQGCLITEYPLGTGPLARQFPARNRIIAGLSRGVIVVEASKRSGSLITARLAAEYGREVGAIPGSPLDTRSHGSNALLKDGALLVEGVDDIMRHIAPAEPSGCHSPANDYLQQHLLEEAHIYDESIEPPSPEHNSENAQATVLEMLSPTPVMVDELCMTCQIPPNQLLTILVELELAGRIERHPGQRVSKVA